MGMDRSSNPGYGPSRTSIHAPLGEGAAIQESLGKHGNQGGMDPLVDVFAEDGAAPSTEHSTVVTSEYEDVDEQSLLMAALVFAPAWLGHGAPSNEHPQAEDHHTELGGRELVGDCGCGDRCLVGEG